MKAIAVSWRGESHRADGRECQDFCHAEARGSFAMAVVCDGHGGRRYFRSRAGAEAAAEVTGECVSELIENADPGLFINEPVTGREALTTERGKKDFRKWDERDELMHRLFAAIAVRWRERIARHAEEHPLTDEELRKVPREYLEAFEARDGSGERTGLAETYGCTLVCCVLTESFWIAFQVGDGKCIAFAPDGKWSEPVPWDESCFLTSTTSLCDDGAPDEFRYCCGGRKTLPMAVFLGSDGVDGSFGDTRGLVDFYVGILKLIGRSGREDAEAELGNVLPELSRRGSGDDVSVACCYDERAVGQALVSLTKWQLSCVEADMNAARSRMRSLEAELQKYQGRGSLSGKDRIDYDLCLKEIDRADESRKELNQRYSGLAEELRGYAETRAGDGAAGGTEAQRGASARDEGRDSGCVIEERQEAEGSPEEAPEHSQPDSGRPAEAGAAPRNEDPDRDRAQELLRKAEQGDAESQGHLGYLYETGRGVPQSFAEARRWYGEAARNGLALALYCLGRMHEEGRGVSQDYGKAAGYYREAASRGEQRSQGRLGYLYETGRGVPQSLRDAADCYRKASERGDAFAQYRLGLMHLKGQGAPLNSVRAEELFRKAAVQGNPGAVYELGSMYLRKQSYDKAFRLLRIAAEQGSARAEHLIGEMYRYGLGVRLSFKEALIWYLKAAGKGNAEAEYSIGDLLLAGQGVPRDAALAAGWYQKSARHGYSKAQYQMGRLYVNGIGVRKDPAEARKWFHLADENKGPSW